MERVIPLSEFPQYIYIGFHVLFSAPNSPFLTN